MRVPEASVEVVNLRLSAIGETDKPEITSQAITDAELPDTVSASNLMVFDGETYSTHFYQRESLPTW